MNNTLLEAPATEHRTSRVDLLILNKVLTDYASTNEVTIERAALEVMKTDDRFSGGFSPSEIGIILGLKIGDVNKTIDKAIRKIKNPKIGNGKEFKAYVSSDTSVYESDF